MSDDQPTYRVSFFGRRTDDPLPTSTQPTQSGVAKVRMDPSGQWLITTCAEDGQILYERIFPETTMIIVDAEGLY